MDGDESNVTGGEAERHLDDASGAAEELSGAAEAGGALSDEEIAALMAASEAVKEVREIAESAKAEAPGGPPVEGAGGKQPTQAELDMLAAVRAAVAQASEQAAPPPATPPGGMTPEAIDEIAREARADAPRTSGTGAAAAAGYQAQAFMPPALEPVEGGGEPGGIDLLSDVNLNVKIELGRTRMLIEDVLRLAEGAVVELDKLAGDPVDVYVNERHVARGEVLVLNDNFCVRINEILDPDAERAV